MNLSSNILERWKELSSNAVKLLTWVLLSAQQGRLEASYKDMIDGLGWTRRPLQRAVAELTKKECVRVTAAANQHGKTLIEVLIKFDGEDSAGHKNDTTRNKANVAEVKNDTTITKEPVPDIPGGDEKGTTNSAPVAAQAEKDPSARVAAAIEKSKSPAGELTVVQIRTLQYIGFDDRRYLTKGFVAVLQKFGERRHTAVPGITCSQIISECLSHQRTLKAKGRDPSLFMFPPGFQSHRDRLRKAEREAGRRERPA